MADGLHQVGLAHSDAAVQKQRVIRLGRAFGDCARGGMGELVAGADDEIVEGVFGFSCAAPSQSKRCCVAGPRAGLLGGRRSFAVRIARPLPFVPDLRLLFLGHELDIAELQAEVLDGLADQIAVAFADVAELRIRNANKRIGPCA